MTRTNFLSGQYAVLHSFYPDMATDPVGLTMYWDWACEYSYGAGASNCTALNHSSITRRSASPVCTTPTMRVDASRAPRGHV